MKKYYLLIMLCALLLSCKENNVDPIDDNNFGLELSVKNNVGVVQPNINVSICSRFDGYKLFKNISGLSKPSNIQAATTIRYDIIQQCFVDLSSYTLDGKKKDNYVSGRYSAGSYSVNSMWDKTNGAFKIKLIASSDSLKKNILFTDSIYVVRVDPDPSISFVGKTDSNGKLKITNKLLFPNLYKLPSIPHTASNSPDALGYFTYSDSVNITLSNESFSKSMNYVKIIKEGANNYQLEWTSAISKISSQTVNYDMTKNNTVVKKISNVSANWKLSQNYPNPFN